jgi:hypothetical protein
MVKIQGKDIIVLSSKVFWIGSFHWEEFIFKYPGEYEIKNCILINGKSYILRGEE